MATGSGERTGDNVVLQLYDAMMLLTAWTYMHAFALPRLLLVVMSAHQAQDGPDASRSWELDTHLDTVTPAVEWG
jgi:hypothetical protein